LLLHVCATAAELTDKHVKIITSFSDKYLASTTLKHPVALFSEQKILSRLFSSPPFSAQGIIDVYFIIDEKTVYFFCTYNERYFSLKIKFNEIVHTLSDPGRIRLVDTGYHTPQTIFTYLAHRTYMESNLIKLHDYFYRAFYPKRPHPAINYPALTKETVIRTEEAVAFMKMYDQTLYSLYASSVKEHADARLK